MKRLYLLALIALAACGSDTATDAAPEGSGVIMLSTVVPPTLITSTTARITIEVGQTERYVELLGERGMTRSQALGTVDAARSVCAGMATAGDSLNDSLWEGIAESARAAGPDERSVRIAAVAGVTAFCPELAYRVPPGFDA